MSYLNFLICQEHLIMVLYWIIYICPSRSILHSLHPSLCPGGWLIWAISMDFLVLWHPNGFIQWELSAWNWRKGREWGWGKFISYPSFLLSHCELVSFLPNYSYSLQVLVPIPHLASSFRLKEVVVLCCCSPWSTTPTTSAYLFQGHCLHLCKWSFIKFSIA